MAANDNNYKTNIIDNSYFGIVDDYSINYFGSDNTITHAFNVVNSCDMNDFINDVKNSKIQFSCGNFTRDSDKLKIIRNFSVRYNTYGVDSFNNSLEVPIVVTSSIFSSNFYAGRILDALLDFKNSGGTLLVGCNVEEDGYTRRYIFSDTSNQSAGGHKYALSDLNSLQNMLHPALLKPENMQQIYLKYIPIDYDGYYETASSTSPLNKILDSGIENTNSNNCYNCYFHQKSPGNGSSMTAGGSGSKLYLKSLTFYFKLYKDENTVITKNDIVGNDKDIKEMLDSSITFLTSDNGAQICQTFSFKDASTEESNDESNKIFLDKNDNFVIKIYGLSSSSYFYIGKNDYEKEDENELTFKNMRYDVSFIQNADSTKNNTDGCVNVNIHNFLKTRLQFNVNQRPAKIECVKVIPEYLDDFFCTLKYSFDLRKIIDKDTDLSKNNDRNSNSIDDYNVSLNVVQPFVKLTKQLSKNDSKNPNQSFTFANGYRGFDNGGNIINIDVGTNDNKITFDYSTFNGYKFIYKIIKNLQSIKFSIDFDNVTYDNIPVKTLFNEMPMKIENNNTTHTFDIGITCSIAGINETDIINPADKMEIITPIMHDVMSYDKLNIQNTVMLKCDSNNAIECTLPFYDIKKYLNDDINKQNSIINYKINDLEIDSENFCDVSCNFVCDSSTLQDENGNTYAPLKLETSWDAIFNSKGDVLKTTKSVKFMIKLKLIFKNTENLAKVLDTEFGIKYDGNDNKEYVSNLFNDMYISGNNYKITGKYEFNTINKTIADDLLYPSSEEFFKDEIYNISANSNIIKDDDSKSSEVYVFNDITKVNYAILVMNNSTCKISLFSTDDIKNIKEQFGECLTDKYSLYATRVVRDYNGNILYPKIINEL